ncbi:MAG: adenylate/guanylate cyclase domain-containing protein [Nevskiales bacterium]|nr:adenylate/guanylate cyclase domain-containing protein [Nevskiales bacterium]
MYPQTRYAQSHGGDVAYQVIGEGPVDLLYCGGLLSHLELVWDYPEAERYLMRMAAFARVILMDRRGVGISEALPCGALPSLDDWSDDLLAVLDDVGSTQAAIYVERDAAALGMTLAARHPERVRALVLGNATACLLADQDFPDGLPAEAVDQLIAMIHADWGTDKLSGRAVPSRREGDQRFAQKAARFQRSAATPATAAAQSAYFARCDLRELLPQVHCPTLIVHHRDYAVLSPAHAHYLRDHLPNAELLMLDGGDAFFLYQGGDAVLRRVESFLTGRAHQLQRDRVLQTVLFVDIVRSTETASELGDAEWRNRLDNFHAIVEQELERHGARLVDVSGDGVFATLSGPTPGIACARAVRDAVRQIDLDVRAGLHCGECEVSDDAVRGLTVHIGARIAAEAAPGEVWVSRTVRDLVVGSGLIFRHRGPKRLKGVPGVWRLFRVEEDAE